MSDVYVLNLARFIFALIVFGLASMQDWKDRLVSDKFWYAMIIFGIAVLEIEFGLARTDAMLYTFPIPLLCTFLVIYNEAVIFEEKSKKVNAAASGLLIITTIVFLSLMRLFGDFNNFIKILDIILMMLLAYAFYRMRILAGGADAKAFLSLAVLVPSTPYMWSFPLIRVLPQMDLVFPFCLVILLNSAVLVLAYPVVVLIYNLAKRNFGFPMWYAYKMSIDDVKKRHVWITEDIEDGETVYYMMASKIDDEEQNNIIKKLKKAGKKEVWVQTKIPFMIPLFFGTIVSFIYGNFILALIISIMG